MVPNRATHQILTSTMRFPERIKRRAFEQKKTNVELFTTSTFLKHVIYP